MVLHSLSLPPPVKKKARAVKTAPTTAAMAAESLSQRGTLTNPDESRLFGWSGVLTVGGLALDLLECRFQFRRSRHIHAFDETMPRFILGTVGQIDAAQASKYRRHFG